MKRFIDLSSEKKYQSKEDSVRKTLALETVYSTDLVNAIGYDELTEAALKVPRIRRLFKEHLKECGVEPQITEAAVEGAFGDFLDEVLDNADVKISINIAHLE